MSATMTIAQLVNKKRFTHSAEFLRAHPRTNMVPWRPPMKEIIDRFDDEHGLIVETFKKHAPDDEGKKQINWCPMLQYEVVRDTSGQETMTKSYLPVYLPHSWHPSPMGKGECDDGLCILEEEECTFCTFLLDFTQPGFVECS